MRRLRKLGVNNENNDESANQKRAVETSNSIKNNNNFLVQASTASAANVKFISEASSAGCENKKDDNKNSIFSGTIDFFKNPNVFCSQRL